MKKKIRVKKGDLVFFGGTRAWFVLQEPWCNNLSNFRQAWDTEFVVVVDVVYNPGNVFQKLHGPTGWDNTDVYGEDAIVFLRPDGTMNITLPLFFDNNST